MFPNFDKKAGAHTLQHTATHYNAPVGRANWIFPNFEKEAGTSSCGERERDN